MTDLLIKLFIKKDDDRIKYGNLASVTGIICNVMLCVLKVVVGFVFSSIAITADAINNLSDAANSVISYIGFVASAKPADKDHPYGHARYEYLACFLVSFVILMLGLTILKESVLKIIHPSSVEVNIISILVLIIAILVKLWMSRFYKKIGKIINSNVLAANSVDSLNDVISTSVILITALITKLTAINLDGIAGCAVSVLILYSGIGILRDTIDDLIGTTPEPELINNIITKLKSYEAVIGIHDLVVHSYGPNNYFATVHVEVSSHEDILRSHDMIDNIERDFARELGINMVIHLDPLVMDDEETNEIKSIVTDIVTSINSDISIHDFRMVKCETHTNLIFDVLVPSTYSKKDDVLIKIISDKICEYNSDFNTIITIDKHYI